MNNPEHDTYKPEPQDCEKCKGKRTEKYSDCCGAPVIRSIHPKISSPVCTDCSDHCHVIHSKCETCNGEGYIDPDDESPLNEHLDLLEHLATGN